VQESNWKRNNVVNEAADASYSAMILTVSGMVLEILNVRQNNTNIIFITIK